MNRAKETGLRATKLDCDIVVDVEFRVTESTVCETWLETSLVKLKFTCAHQPRRLIKAIYEIISKYI